MAPVARSEDLESALEVAHSTEQAGSKVTGKLLEDEDWKCSLLVAVYWCMESWCMLCGDALKS